MKIWITGIAGFLGSHLADALMAKGHHITGNDSLICGDELNSPVVPWPVDCADFNAMQRCFARFQPDIVIHCAATAHEGLSSFSPSFITRNIFEASVATFSAAVACGVKRIVTMSSMSRYGAQQPPFTEDMPCKPVDPYGIAKAAAEDVLRVLCNTHGVQFAIAVPHNIIGTRQRSIDPYRNVAAIMINRCKQGKGPIVYGLGDQRRSFSPVRDCIPALLRMVEGAADGEVVNIGPDKNEMTIFALAQTIRHMTRCNAPVTHMPSRPNEVRNAFCGSDKARRLLGYVEQQTIEECLQEMVNSITPAPFQYDFPIEIQNARTPRTWTEKLI